ncbi:myb family transcription factor EFM-like isoform X1 [Asparagus officinalis]|nr:myb family transcription factor EFM-like isoform X1 [Asparagus officinalis]
MDYLKALEEERKKILVFERELPLSLQLVTQAIESCKKKKHEVVGRGEEIASEGPILEEFIPLRPSCSSSDEENNHKNSGNSGGSDKKPDCMRSVQLWNQQPEPKGDVVMKPIAVNAKRIGGAFHPFEKEKVVVKTPVVAVGPVSSTTENSSGGNVKTQWECRF